MLLDILKSLKHVDIVSQEVLVCIFFSSSATRFSGGAEWKIEEKNWDLENNYVIFLKLIGNMLMTGGAIQVTVPKMFDWNN